MPGRLSEVATAANSILNLPSSDQYTLLKVFEDYFFQTQLKSKKIVDLSDTDDGAQDPIPDSEDSSSEDEPTLDSQVEEALTRLPTSYIEEIECVPTELDKKETETVHQFMTRGCGCSLCGGQPCSSQFTVDYALNIRASCLELLKCELDLVILGQLMASTNTSEMVGTAHKHKETQRQRQSIEYHHMGKPVCTPMFRFLHAVGEQHVCLRVLVLESTKEVVTYLLNFTEQNGLLLPGRIPGYSRTDIKLLPSSVSKRGIWKCYSAAMSSIHTIPVAYTTFCRLWRELLPQVVTMKPMSDLCWICQQNSRAIIRSANRSDSEKSDKLKAGEDHLVHVRKERIFYRQICETSKKSVREFFLENGTFSPPPLFCKTPANSIPIKSHYSFDYAQQVHYPSNPLQPGPLYFLTPRKCAVFGVNCEAIPRQVNFLCDEAGDCGKGANTVVSQLHFFFQNHGLGEKEVYLHADNSITLSFLVAGHTKFSPDWCFGLFKRLYRRSVIGSLRDIADVVDSSANCNTTQLITEPDGTSNVTIFNWTDFFANHFKKIPQIKSKHHFRLSSSHPGVVFTKTTAESPEEEINILKTEGFTSGVLPDVTKPRGLSAERQWYLYESIREFCPEKDRDITCPLPLISKPENIGSLGWVTADEFFIEQTQ